jgi:hypothetical protein
MKIQDENSLGLPIPRNVGFLSFSIQRRHQTNGPGVSPVQAQAKHSWPPANTPKGMKNPPYPPLLKGGF